jgi:CBS domain containing-hemolysin-like protein
MILLLFVFSFLAVLFYTALRASLAASLRLRLELESHHRTFAGRTASLFIRETTRVSLSIKTGRSFFFVTSALALYLLCEPCGCVASGYSIGSFIFSLLASVLFLLAGDAFTGNISRQHPYFVLRVLAPLFLLSYAIFWPLTSLLFNLRQRIFQKQGGSEKKESRAADFEELVNSLYEGNPDTAQEPEVQILQNAIDFQDVKAGSCMIPRSEVVAMEINSPVEELVRRFTSTRLTRILIFRESIENIIGYVHSFEMFRKPVSIISVIRPVVVVPETIGVQDLLTLFIKQRRNIAVVVDEYGGTSGILTMEDVIEELFGEIDDEHDNDQLLEKKLNEKQYLFSARLEIAYLNEKYGFSLPESKDFSTLGGLVVHLGEGLPRPRQKLFSDHFRLEVVEVKEHRLETVKLILK